VGLRKALYLVVTNELARAFGEQMTMSLRDP
jgi:hypothetical protein